MRKISERQRWIMLGHDHFGGFRNPTCRYNRGCGPPKLKQRKRAETLRQPLAQLSRHGIAIWKLAAVGLIDRSRRHAHVMARGHIVPPEHVGACEAAIAFL